MVPEIGTRRASPIWFRVIRVNDKQYGLLAMLWNCVYLPKGEGVAIGLTAGAKVPVPCVPDEAAAWFEGLLKSPQDRFIRG